MTNSFCWCGRVGKQQFNFRCVRHASKEAPKKLEKVAKFRGDSKFQRENQMFNNKGE